MFGYEGEIVEKSLKDVIKFCVELKMIMKIEKFDNDYTITYNLRELEEKAPLVISNKTLNIVISISKYFRYLGRIYLGRNQKMPK